MTIRRWGVTLRWPQMLAITVMLIAVVVLAFTLATLVRGVQETSAKQDVLLERLTQNQEQDTRDAVEFRQDSRRLQLAICDQIEAIAKQYRLPVPPCPRVETP